QPSMRHGTLDTLTQRVNNALPASARERLLPSPTSHVLAAQGRVSLAMALPEAPGCSPPRPRGADRPRLRGVRTFPRAVPRLDVAPGAPLSTGTAPVPVLSVAPARPGRGASL